MSARLLSRAEKRATRAVAAFERATAELRAANEHLAVVKDAAVAKEKAIVAKAEALAKQERDRFEAAVKAHERNNRIIAKIENLLG